MTGNRYSYLLMLFCFSILLAPHLYGQDTSNFEIEYSLQGIVYQGGFGGNTAEYQQTTQGSLSQYEIIGIISGNYELGYTAISGDLSYKVVPAILGSLPQINSVDVSSLSNLNSSAVFVGYRYIIDQSYIPQLYIPMRIGLGSENFSVSGLPYSSSSLYLEMALGAKGYLGPLGYGLNIGFSGFASDNDGDFKNANIYLAGC